MASFTAALARLKMYCVLEKLDDRVLKNVYMDSVVFKTDPVTTDFLGDLTNKIDDTGDEFIKSWLCGGPKNYSYRTSKGITVCKVRGFTLNAMNSLVINHDTLNELIQREQGAIRTIHKSKIIRDVKTKTILTVKRSENYQVVFTKRVRLEDGNTLPYGHADLPPLPTV